MLQRKLHFEEFCEGVKKASSCSTVSIGNGSHDLKKTLKLLPETKIIILPEIKGTGIDISQLEDVQEVALPFKTCWFENFDPETSLIQSKTFKYQINGMLVHEEFPNEFWQEIPR